MRGYCLGSNEPDPESEGSHDRYPSAGPNQCVRGTRDRGVGAERGCGHRGTAARGSGPVAAPHALARSAGLSAGDGIVAVLPGLTVVPVSCPQALELSFAARPDRLADVRHRVHAWLERCAMDERQVSDVLLAVDEACTNAVEHGHRADGGPVSVSAFCEGDTLCVVVADRGRWKPHEADPDPMRGRGMAIIRSVFPHVVVRSGDTGTVVEMRTQRIASASPQGSARSV